MPILLEFQKIRNNRTKHEAYKKKKKPISLEFQKN
jgi:hypothetical protein